MVAEEGGDEPPGFVQRFNFVVHLQFAVNVFGVLLHRLGTDVQVGRNFLAGLALRHQVEDLGFATGDGVFAG